MFYYNLLYFLGVKHTNLLPRVTFGVRVGDSFEVPFFYGQMRCFFFTQNRCLPYFLKGLIRPY